MYKCVKADTMDSPSFVWRIRSEKREIGNEKVPGTQPSIGAKGSGSNCGEGMECETWMGDDEKDPEKGRGHQRQEQQSAKEKPRKRSEILQ